MTKIDLPMNYDFIVLHSNYISRMPFSLIDDGKPDHDAVKKYFEETFYATDNPDSHLVFIKDQLWCRALEEVHLYGDQNDVGFITKHYNYDGIIVFKNLNFGEVMKAISRLQKLNSCAFCNHEHITQIIVNNIEGKTVLYVEHSF